MTRVWHDNRLSCMQIYTKKHRGKGSYITNTLPIYTYEIKTLKTNLKCNSSQIYIRKLLLSVPIPLPIQSFCILGDKVCTTASKRCHTMCVHILHITHRHESSFDVCLDCIMENVVNAATNLYIHNPTYEFFFRFLFASGAVLHFTMR